MGYLNRHKKRKKNVFFFFLNEPINGFEKTKLIETLTYTDEKKHGGKINGNEKEKKVL